METSATRRNFMKRSLKYGALVGAGAAGAVSGMTALSPKNLFAKTGKTYEWPWPYAKLDPESGRKLGHDAYWSGKGCSYAAFHAIVSALQKKIGGPYDGLPAEIMIYGHGGGAGWGMLCGALNGPAAAISLVCDKKSADLLINELFQWYSQTMLPTDLSNQYAVEKNTRSTNTIKRSSLVKAVHPCAMFPPQNGATIPRSRLPGSNAKNAAPA